jgi:hypothetical protein
MEIVYVVIFTILVLVFVTVRIIDNSRSKIRGARIVKKIKDNPAYIKELSDSITLFILKRKYENTICFNTKTDLRENTII